MDKKEFESHATSMHKLIALIVSITLIISILNLGMLAFNAGNILLIHEIAEKMEINKK